MDRIQLPADLSLLDDNQLEVLEVNTVAKVREFAAGSPKPTEANLTTARELTADRDAIQGEIAQRKANETELEALLSEEVAEEEALEVETAEETVEVEAAEETPVVTEETPVEEASAEVEEETQEPEQTLEVEEAEEVAEEVEQVEPVAEEAEEAAPVAEEAEEPVEVETQEEAEVVAEEAAPEVEAEVETLETETEEVEVTEEVAEEVAEEVVAEDTLEATEETQTEEIQTEGSEELEVEVTKETEMNEETNEGAPLKAPQSLSVTTNTNEANTIVAGEAAPGLDTGTVITQLQELSVEVLDAWRKAGGQAGWSLKADVYEQDTIAQVRAFGGEEFTIGRDAESNYSVVQKALESYEASRSLADGDEEGLVASGGICAPFEPDYTFFRLATPQSPIESCLPTVRAPRGGIRFISPPDYRDARPGVNVVTCAEDAAGYVSTPEECGGPGPTEDKPCVCVECPEIVDCCISGISACVRWGNFNYYTFPEQVAAFTADLAVNFAAVKEQLYLDTIDAASTQVTSGQSYGAARDVLWDLRIAATNYRKRHHMDRNSVLEVFIPDFLVDIIRQDLLNDHSLGLNFLNATDGIVDSAIRSLGLRPCYYYDGATGVDTHQGAQAAGPLNQFPETAKAYIFAPGTFVRLDSGSLDFGIVRDSALNRTNDLTLFMEEFTNVCYIGLESICLEMTICPDGSAPLGVDPLCSSNG